MLRNSYIKCSDQEGLDDDLSCLATWSADHGFIINKTKCVEYLFSSKTTSSQLPFSFLKGEALSRAQTVKYLCVHFTSNMTWSTHNDTLSEGFAQLTLTNPFKSELFQPLLSLHILYCSPIIFPGLLNKDFNSIKKAYVCYQLPVV